MPAPLYSSLYCEKDENKQKEAKFGQYYLKEQEINKVLHENPALIKKLQLFHRCIFFFSVLKLYSI